jgi:putative ABC transport system permease protein
VGDELLAIADDTATLSDPQTVAGALQASPAASGLLAVLVISLITSALLAAIAIVLASVVGARSRSRMVALLSTLGLRPAQSSALVAWELAPVSIMAIIAGTALGIAMPWVVLSSVDLTPFTGGSLQPSVVVDPLLVALLAAAMVAVVAVSIAVSVFTARRRNAASALRMGEE